MNGDYDPDAMFPKREKKAFMKRVKEKIKRLLKIIGLSAFVILCGAGCKSLENAKSIEIDTMFIDFEWQGKDKE